MAFAITDYVDSPAFNSTRKAQSTRRISYYDLVPSSDNFYSMQGIEELKASIELVGRVLHNLVVTPLDDGKYKILSGHRRYTAIGQLLEEGKDEYEFIPCDIDKLEADENGIHEQTLLIAANSQREKTAWDKLEEVRHLRDLLRKTKEQTGTTGRVRDMVAKTLHVSASRIAKYDSILNNLTAPLKDEIKAERLPISVAYELSTLPADQQQLQFDFFLNHGKLPSKDVFHRNTQTEAVQAANTDPDHDVFHRNTQTEGVRPATADPDHDVFHQNTQTEGVQPATADPDHDVFHWNTEQPTSEEKALKALDNGIRKAVEKVEETAEKTAPKKGLTLTKEDILQLTNNDKRKAILDRWREWPIWADVPEIGLTVHRLDLPNGNAFTACWYAGDDFYPSGGEHNVNRPRLHLIGSGGKLAAGSQAESVLVECLQNLRKEMS